MSRKIDEWFGLEGTTCVVLGANGLLGRACVRAMLDAGAQVIAADLVFDGADSGSDDSTRVKLDATKDGELKKFFSDLHSKKSGAKRWAFINCSYPRTSNWGKLGFENVTLEDWNKNVELHLGSAFRFSQEAVLFLKGSGGSLINFGSIYGQNGPDMSLYAGTSMENPSPYSAIKSGIVGITRYIATRYGSENIRANVVCPGGIENSQSTSFVKNYVEKTPLKRMGHPRDIAGMVAFLVGPSAEYITGQVFLVDGGWTAW